MRLLQLKPFYFRAYGDNSPITFANNLTIIYGGNGSGKSSLAESLEWLFYGSTKRRRKGDQYSKTEYKGSYIHKGCPPDAAPYVEAEVIFSDESKHILRRTMKLDDHGKVSDTDSIIIIDGQEVSDLYDLGISSDAYCPIVVQHGIQDFIHTRPIERYRIISEALGLSELTKFKDALEQAKNRYKSNPPQKVTDARVSLKRSVKALQEIGLSEIALRWNKGEVEEQIDRQLIFQKAVELSCSQAKTFDELLKDVKNRQALEITKLFDISPYKPNVNSENLLERVKTITDDLLVENRNILGAANELTHSIITKYSELQLTFWNQGLAIIEHSGTNFQSGADLVNCPFCNKLTLEDSKLAEIRNNVSGSNELDEKRSKLKNALSGFDSVLREIENFFPQLEFASIQDQQMQSLRKMFSRGVKQIDDFAEENHQAFNRINLFITKTNSLKAFINKLQRDAISPEDVIPALEPLAGLINELINLLSDATTAFRKFTLTFSTFLPVLQRELSDEKSVSIFTNLVELLSTKPLMDLVIMARKYEGEILKCQQIADDYILRQQKLILDDREKDILTWYSRLSPNQDVKFSGLEPGKSEFNLKATAFGKELNAAASLSQSQLNCLGLSVYIPSIIAPAAPFQFIVFDDPVQAMDDDHHEAFLLKVVPELLGTCQRQVIVLTHLKPTADRLRSLNYDCCPIYYRLDKLTSDGPQMRLFTALKEEAKQIRDLSEGNEENRILSVDRLRVLCEIVMREAHLKINGSIMPPTIINPRPMLQVFRKLKGVTPSIVQQLTDTISWSDPSHHTDPEWQTPDSSAIKLHLDRLQSIIGTLGLQSD